jgi:predicted O-linked N-acetylglucosamine transferase (SPINDLY family)
VVNPSPRQDPGRTVSPEFRKHPVGYLTAEIFESHDPDRFEPYAFSTVLTTTAISASGSKNHFIALSIASTRSAVKF